MRAQAHAFHTCNFHVCHCQPVFPIHSVQLDKCERHFNNIATLFPDFKRPHLKQAYVLSTAPLEPKSAALFKENKEFIRVSNTFNHRIKLTQQFIHHQVPCGLHINEDFSSSSNFRCTTTVAVFQNSRKYPSRKQRSYRR